MILLPAVVTIVHFLVYQCLPLASRLKSAGQFLPTLHHIDS